MIDQPDDDIAKTLIEGDTYEQAALNVDRFIPLSLAAKLYLAVGTLALSVTVAPAVMFRRGLVRSLEGTNSLSLTLGVLVLNGILTTVLGGVLLIRQQYIVDNNSLTVKQARKLIRLEDLYVLAVILGGMFIAASAALVWGGGRRAGCRRDAVQLRREGVPARRNARCRPAAHLCARWIRRRAPVCALEVVCRR
jgi:hypothetical protein